MRLSIDDKSAAPTLNPLLLVIPREPSALRHFDAVPFRHSEPFLLCHSEGAQRPKNLTQLKLGERQVL